jgi:hypothetical protein
VAEMIEPVTVVEQVPCTETRDHGLDATERGRTDYGAGRATPTGASRR